MNRASITAAVGYFGAWVAAAAFLADSLYWYVAPESHSAALGTRLGGHELIFVYMTAVFHLMAALGLGIFLARKDRVGTIVMLVASFFLPLGIIGSQFRVGLGELYTGRHETLLDVHVFYLFLAVIILLSLVGTIAAKGSALPFRMMDRKDPLIPSGRSGFVSYLLPAAAALPVLFGVVNAITGYLTPEVGPELFQVSMEGDKRAYIYVRPLQEAFVFLTIGLSYLRWRRPELMIGLAVAALTPVGDQLSVELVGIRPAVFTIANMVYFSWVSLVILLLWRQGRRSRASSGRR